MVELVDTNETLILIETLVPRVDEHEVLFYALIELHCHDVRQDEDIAVAEYLLKDLLNLIILDES